MAEENSVVLEYDSIEFIRRIRRFVDQGYGFIPLIGSGMSAPSGILMGQTFTDFLSYTIYLVLCPPDERKIERFLPTEKQWNIRKDGWPNYPSKREMDAVRDWLLNKFTEICKRRGFEAKKFENTIVDITPVQKTDAKHATSMELVSALSRPLVPKLICSKHYSPTEDIAKRLLKVLDAETDSVRFTGPLGFSPTSQDFVIEDGITSLHDWRATLEFLSRVDLCDIAGTERSQLVLREADPSVIDGFNLHITRDKRHNLGHKMLTHLARPMRIRTILTTNFDSLIEEAFKNVSKPLNVLPVSVKGGLPDPKTVRAQNSIIKLHGELLETRADFSLDVDPQPEDKQRFVQYFLGNKNSFAPSRTTTGKSVIPSHLIVMGYSGSDLRCIQMIKHLLDAEPTVRIFWICFSKWDVEKITKIFAEDSYQSRILLHQTNRPDLLLYELYQNLSLCLPGGGFAYEFSHKVPPRRYSAKNTVDDKVVRDLCNGIEQDVDVFGLAKDWCEAEVDIDLSAKRHLRYAISKSLARFIVDSLQSNKPKQLSAGLNHYATLAAFPAKQSGDSGPINSIAVDLCSGASSSLNFAFKELSEDHNKNCVWLELQDYITPETLLQDILRVIALRIGRYQLEHITLFPGGKLPLDRSSDEADELVDHLTSLFVYLNEIPEQWVLFLYGRNAPGACSGWENQVWTQDQYQKLTCMIDILARVGLKIVYAPLTQKRVKREQEKYRLINEDKFREVCEDYGLFTSAEEFDHKSLQKGLPEKVVEFEKFYKKATGIHRDRNTPYITDSKFPLTVGEPVSEGSTEREAIDYHDLGEQWQSTDDTKFKEQRVVSVFEPLVKRLLDNWIFEGRYDDLEIEDREQIQAKFKFLFAITLFRQSRHTSAFFSDAVYSCPFRFNLKGIDNDWTRAESVKRWIAELRKLGVFYYKPGGYCWKHRDIRLSIQLLLQKLPLFRCENFFDPISAADDDKVERTRFRHAFLLETRARAHYWISDWYFKAFATTGHSTPAIETLYHGFKCAEYAGLARPSRMDYRDRWEDIVRYRFLLFRSAVVNMTKTLRVGHRWLKFWLSSTFIHPMLNPDAELSNGESLEEKLFGIVKRLGCRHDEKPDETEERWKTEINTARQLVLAFIDERKRLGRAVAGEGGAYPGKIRKVVFEPELKEEIPSDRKEFKQDDIEITFSPQLVGKPKDAVESWNTQFNRWFADEGFLNCEKLVSAIESINSDFESGQIEDLIAMRTDFNKSLASWRGSWASKYAACGRLKVTLVSLLSEYAYLHVKRAKMEYHARSTNTWNRDHNPVRWMQATGICNVGIDLAKHFPPERADDEIACKCKLHTLYALSLANLDRYYEAHRHLNESIALLSKSSIPMDPIQLGIIRLRRAEVYLTEGLRICSVLCGEWSEDTDLRRGVIDELRDIETEIRRLKKLEVKQQHECKPNNETRDKIQSLKESFDSLMTWRPFEYRQDEESDQLQKNPESHGHADTGDHPRHYVPPIRNVKHEKIDCNLNNNRIVLHPIAYELYKKLDDNTPLDLRMREDLVDTLDRYHTACLDDAYNELEMARLLLSGKSQSSLWWSKLISLKLRIYGAQHRKSNYESLAFCRRIEHGAKAIELLQRGLLICRNEPYKGLKIIDYFLKAWKIVSIHDRNKGQDLTKTTRTSIQNALDRYRECLRKEDFVSNGEVYFDPDGYESTDESLHLVHRYYLRVKAMFSPWLNVLYTDQAREDMNSLNDAELPVAEAIIQHIKNHCDQWTPAPQKGDRILTDSRFAIPFEEEEPDDPNSPDNDQKQGESKTKNKNDKFLLLKKLSSRQLRFLQITTREKLDVMQQNNGPRKKK